MNNAINMLPCPMCGCSSINVKNEQPTDNSGGYFIECPDCGISTSLRYACGDDPIPLLAEQWNRRATAQCLHQIAEPAAPVVKPIKDAIDALVMAAFTEGGCSEHRMSEARIQTELRKKELRTLIAATQPAAQGMEADLTDEQIDEAFNQMPDGAAGFLKSWGYRQFARAVLAAQAKQGGAA